MLKALALEIVRARRLVQDQQEVAVFDDGALTPVGVLAETGADGFGKGPIGRDDHGILRLVLGREDSRALLIYPLFLFYLSFAMIIIF